MTERLLDAVASYRYKQIECLIGSGVDANSRNSRGQTALMIACFLSQEDKRYRMFRFLMQHKADILDLDDNDTSVFHYACMRGCKDIVEVILNKASVAAVNLASADHDGRTALFYAVSNGNVDIVKLLIPLMKDRGISVDTADKSGRTPLLQATMLGHGEIAEILEVEGRANPRICDREMHMNAKGWAEESARKQQTIEEHNKEQSRVRQLIFPKLSGCARVDAIENQKKTERSVSLPMISYTDITQTRDKNDQLKELESIPESELSPRKQCNKKQLLNNKSVDSAMSLVRLSRKRSKHSIHIETVAAANMDEQSDSEYTFSSSSNLGIVHQYLDICSEQQTPGYRRTAAPRQTRTTPRQGLPPIRDRFLKFATLAKVLPNQNAMGINFLTIKTKSRGNTPNADVDSQSTENGLEGLPEPSASPAAGEGGSMWKRLRKKSMMNDVPGGDGGGGGDCGGGSILSRLKKAKNNNSVPSINVSAHAR